MRKALRALLNPDAFNGCAIPTLSIWTSTFLFCGMLKTIDSVLESFCEVYVNICRDEGSWSRRGMQRISFWKRVPFEMCSETSHDMAKKLHKIGEEVRKQKVKKRKKKKTKGRGRAGLGGLERSAASDMSMHEALSEIRNGYKVYLQAVKKLIPQQKQYSRDIPQSPIVPQQATGLPRHGTSSGTLQWEILSGKGQRQLHGVE
jgi:hypothetical protein